MANSWAKEESGPIRARMDLSFRTHAGGAGGVLFPLGEAGGGHGCPGVGLIPGLLGDVPLGLSWPFALPGVDGFAAPAFGVEPVVPLAVPGKVPHGEPVGEPPGLFGVGLAEG